MLNLLLLLCLYLPFQIALNPAEGIDLASVRIIIPALFLLWLAKGLKDKKIIIKKSLVSALISTFLFLSALSIEAARNADWSARKLLFIFSIFPIYFVVSAVISDKSRVEKMVKFLVWGGALAATIGIIQFSLQFTIGLEKTYAIWSDYIIWPFLGSSFGKVVLENPSWLVNISGKTILRATSTFPDPHMLSFYLGLLIPLALGLFFKLKKPLYLLFFAILFLGDILTFSRGGYLGLLAGALAIFIIVVKKFSLKYKIAAALTVAVITGILFFPGPVSDRFSSSLNLQESSNAGRMEMWQKAGKIISDKPFLGVGIGNYPLEIKPGANWREPIYAHNTYLDIAVETGIINALIWMAIVVSSIFIFLKKSKDENLYFWLAVSIAIFSVHSLVETALYSPVVLTLFLIIISFTNIKSEDEKIV
jgi:O-antigen ligase